MRISDWSSDVCSSDLRHSGSGDRQGGVDRDQDPSRLNRQRVRCTRRSKKAKERASASRLSRRVASGVAPRKPCSDPGRATRSTRAPAARIRAAIASDWRIGTVVSAVPWISSIGGVGRKSVGGGTGGAGSVESGGGRVRNKKKEA